jgi:two-component system phosphate regulon sensor histidine kinase PhoR
MPNAARRPAIAVALLLVTFAAGWLMGLAPAALLLGSLAGAAIVLIGWRDPVSAEAIRPAPPPPAGRDHWARQVMDAVADPMLLLEDGRVQVANRSALQLLGDWIEGQDVRLALRHPATVERLSRPVAPQAAPEQVEIIGLVEPERRWLLTAAPLADGSRLVQLSDRSGAAAAERMRVDFVANASHELRTPLATVLGFIETLQDDDAAEDKAIRARFLGLMLGEARRMQQLIEDLMSLSRIEAERFSAPTDPVDLLPLVDEIRTGCANLLEERGVDLAVAKESASTIVPGDRGQLLQLLRNLVVNAVKYGRADSQVTVRFEDDGPEAVRMTVTDQGEGIAPEHLPRLTERFYRVDPGRSRSVGGTGLGLAIVKHIVGRHRGRLDIRSTPGVGTSVSVSLPRVGEPLS